MVPIITFTNVKVMIRLFSLIAFVNVNVGSLTNMDKCKTSTNPSAIRSKSQITDALMYLAAKKPLVALTVKEICEAADVTRPTFYNHFESKEDVIGQILEKASDDFILLLDEQPYLSTDLLIDTFFSFWSQKPELLKVMVDNSLLQMMANRSIGDLEAIYRRIEFKDAAADEVELGYHNAFLSNAMSGMLGYWVEHDMRDAPILIAQYMKNVIRILYRGTIDEEAQL